MSGRRLFALLQRLLVVVVLTGSGGYLLVYLYRWEWNRALISGLVFVAAEIALVASMLTRRVAANGCPPTSYDLALTRLRQAGVDRRHPFRWLGDPGRTSVFVPVLLGAGVVLSALAYLVERLAEATAHATVDRRLARRLSAFAPTRPPTAPVEVLRWGTAPRRAGPVAGLVAAAVIVGLTVQVLAEATQSRPDASARPASTSILVAVDQKTGEPVLDTAAALWVACRPVLPARNRPAVRLRAEGDAVLFVLEPGIRDLTTRRLTGCLADATLASVRAEVLEVRHLRSTPRARAEKAASYGVAGATCGAVPQTTMAASRPAATTAPTRASGA